MEGFKVERAKWKMYRRGRMSCPFCGWTLDGIVDIMVEDIKKGKYNICPKCLLPGSMVFDGSKFIEIENIKKDQELFNGRVINTFNRYYKGNILTIKPLYFPEIKCTPEHPFMIREIYRTINNHLATPAYWKKAEDIIPNNLRERKFDSLVLPKIKIIKDIYLDFKPYIKKFIKVKRFKEKIKLTPEIARMFGWYVAEGCSAGRRGIIFSLSKKELNKIKEIENGLNNLGYHLSKKIRYIGNAINIICESRVLSRAFDNWFGHGAKNKKIPQWMFSANTEIINSFWEGYWQGDGTKNDKKGIVQVVSVSEQLIRQLQMLLSKIGKISSYSHYIIKESIINNRKIKGGSICYTLDINLKQRKLKKYLEDKDNFYIPVHTIKKEKYHGLVYNIETSSEDYHVPFVIHNCQKKISKWVLNKIKTPVFASERQKQIDELSAIFFGNKKSF